MLMAPFHEFRNAAKRRCHSVERAFCPDADASMLRAPFHDWERCFRLRSARSTLRAFASSSEKMFARHREHKIANARSQLAPPSSIEPVSPESPPPRARCDRVRLGARDDPRGDTEAPRA
jgi:hypothetical protein